MELRIAAPGVLLRKGHGCCAVIFDNSGLMCYLLTMRVEWEGKAYEFEKPMAVSRLLEHFSLSRESHLVVVNDALVTEDYKLNMDDRVRVIRVVSGG